MRIPKLSIIVPSYNQGDYLEETLLSIVNQDYPNKELIVIDGGSEDCSVEVIKKYEEHIYYWVSEKDNGQTEAINKGFAKATGDYIAWMNSDDTYYEGAFSAIFSIPDITEFDFIYGPVSVGETPGNARYGTSRKNEKFTLFNLLHFFYSVDYIIPSQSVFIKRSFLQQHGIQFLDENFHWDMDLEWYCRIALAHPKYIKYKQTLSFFRINPTTKTGSKNGQQEEAVQVLLNYRNHLSKREKKRLFNALRFHRILKKIYDGSVKHDTLSLIKIAGKVPSAVTDRRFLGLIKVSFK